MTNAKTPKNKLSIARKALPKNASGVAPLPAAGLAGPETLAQLDDSPGLYGSKYKPEYAVAVAKICALGATDMEISDYFGISKVTLYGWRLRHPEFAEAMNAGKAAADDRVERSLFMNAVGYEYDAIELFVINGQIVEHVIRKRVQANSSAQIFWLKNRRKDIWRDVHQHEVGGPNEFDNMSDSQLAKRMNDAAEALQQLSDLTAGPATPSRNREPLN